MLFNSNLKLAMFDLDGTLIDTLPQISRALDLAMIDAGYRAPGLDDARLWVGNGSKKLVERAVLAARDNDSGKHPAQGDAAVIAMIEQVQSRFFEHYDHCCEVACPLYAGVRELLDYCQRTDVTLACVTNKPARFSQRVLDAAGIGSYFALVISGDSLAERKPHPAPLQHVMSHFEVDARHAVMVGDSRNDILAARAAGVTIIAVDYGYNYGESIPNPETGCDDAPDLLVSNLASCCRA